MIIFSPFSDGHIMYCWTLVGKFTIKWIFLLILETQSVITWEFLKNKTKTFLKMLFSKMRSWLLKISSMSLILNIFLHIYVSMPSSDTNHSEGSAPEHGPQSYLFYTNAHIHSVSMAYYFILFHSSDYQNNVINYIPTILLFFKRYMIINFSN